MDVQRELRVSARVAGGADLLKEANRREFGICVQAALDDGFVRLQLHGPALSAHPLREQIGLHVSCELPLYDPAMNRAAVDPQPPSNRCLGEALFQIVYE